MLQTTYLSFKILHVHIWSKSCDSTEPWKILFVIGMTCLGCKSCLSLIFGTISKGMIDGKLSVSWNTLCIPHSGLSYMDVWVFCSKVTLVASQLQLMDRVELTNHKSVRQKVWSQPGKDKNFSRNYILLVRGQYYHPRSPNNEKIIVRWVESWIIFGIS